MEADVQQAWVTANEAVGQARTEINQLGDEKDQELGMMQQNCRDQIVQLGRECELAMTELSERKADEMRTLEESCRLKSERVHQELQIVVDHAQRKVALLENDCREHVSSEQKVFEARLSQVSEERDSLKKELADVERRKASDKHRTRTLTSYRTPSRARSEEERTHNRPLTPPLVQSQIELEADERHHNAQQQATAKYGKLHRRLEAFRGSAGEQAEAQVAAFRQQHKALRAFTVSKLREVPF